MSYEFTKDCEIMNCEFTTGEVVDEKGVQFYPTVMEQSEKNPTIEVTKVGDTLTKTEVESSKKSADAKSEDKKDEAPKKDTSKKSADVKSEDKKEE